MYHVELRQFPHNMCRFNLADAELRAIVEPWAREKVVDFGERKWSSQTATLTILQGPRIPLEQLTMGRGWRAAERHSEDVTERLLASARQSLAAAPSSFVASPCAPPAVDPRQSSGLAQPPPLADALALGVELASLLGEDPGRLLSAWREVAACSSGLSPSESLALAERQLRS
ncbi:MAG TPA: hypothetical protein VK790_01970 [Solirubrobacteraceae bacterium]|jgi:hypothetical protein|nr:hypothetical protein [Solirubrobacteraceae bacterium]